MLNENCLHMDSPEIQHQPPVEENQMTQAEIAAKYGLAKWIFRRGQDFVKGRVLEIGEGEGHVAKYCRREGVEVEVLNIDLANELFVITYKELLGTFDLVYVLLNGAELTNNRSAVVNSAALLKSEGCLVAVLPCHTALYEGLEQGLSDWKSYNRRYIRTRIATHFNLEKFRFFEMMDHLPPLILVKNGYEERVRFFEKTEVNHFVSIGLFTVAVASKL